MPVRQPVFDPPFNVVRASHVALDVRDIKRSRAFYVDCLGLLVSDEGDGSLYLRGVEERNHHSIVLRQARDAEVRALGFKRRFLLDASPKRRSNIASGRRRRK